MYALNVKKTSLWSANVALKLRKKDVKLVLKRKYIELNTERRGELSTNYPSPTSLAEEGALSTIVLSEIILAC